MAGVAAPAREEAGAMPVTSRARRTAGGVDARVGEEPGAGG
jgi:hypothetical protein